jgi:hypothetical protein
VPGEVVVVIPGRAALFGIVAEVCLVDSRNHAGPFVGEQSGLQSLHARRER